MKKQYRLLFGNMNVTIAKGVEKQLEWDRVQFFFYCKLFSTVYFLILFEFSMFILLEYK